MNLRLCIVTMIPELAYDAANHALENAKEPLTVIIAANCCKIDANRIGDSSTSLAVIEFDDNEGVVPPMHAMWQLVSGNVMGRPNEVPWGDRPGLFRWWCRGPGPFRGVEDERNDILVYIHDDLEILEPGWDLRVKNIMATQPSCAAIGFIGGTGIGAHDIYQRPYEPIQLARHNVLSNMVDAEVHGHRWTAPTKIATADGCALIVRRSFLDEFDGWSWWPEANHGYDNALACMLRRHGREFWLLPIVSRHPTLLKQQGGFSNPYASQRYTERFGDVYSRAHRRLYDEFRDVLPFHVE